MTLDFLFAQQKAKPPAIVVDSSVILAAMRPCESHHDLATRCIAMIRESTAEVWCPATIFWEMGATVNHPGKTGPDAVWNKSFGIDIRHLAVDDELFKRAWRPLPIEVKAADQIFLSVAVALRAPLLTGDGPLRRHAHVAGVTALTPSEFLALR